jgi:uncharacterized membrane protein YhiD involved in acid resistance
VDENGHDEAWTLSHRIFQIPGSDAATLPAGRVLIPSLAAFTFARPIVALILSFILSLTVAIVYKYLGRGVPQVRTFPQTLAVSGIVSAIIVLSIGDSIARGIGLVGALTVIRFRSNLQDPRDLIFAFAALATGVAAGAYAFEVAVVGTLLFIGGTLMVARPWFSGTQTFNAILSFQVAGDSGDSSEVSRLLQSRCHEFSLVRVRQASPGFQEHAYQVRLKQPDRQGELIHDLERVPGIQDALLVAYDGGTEV